MARVSRRGRVLQEREVGDLLLRDIEYAAGSYLERHDHPRPYVSILIAGTYTELCDGLPRVCAPGTIIVHPRREEHSDYFLSAGHCINIDIPAGWIETSERSTGRRSIHVPDRGDERIAVVSAFTQAQPTIRRSALERAMHDLTVTAQPEEHAVDETVPVWLPPLLERFPWIERKPLAQAAGAAGVHTTHFARAFHKHVGVTAREYRKRARLRYASRLLLESSVPLAEVAQAAGFSDQSHFANAFRSIAGMAPGAYRAVFAA